MTESNPSPNESAAKPRLSRLSANDRDRFVAYLDGELDEKEAHSVDRLLATNEIARREINRLSAVYDLLDHLPRPAASTDFTQATMKSVEAVTPADRDVSEELAQHAKRWMPLVQATVLSFVCTLAGLWGGDALFGDRDAAVLENLPAIERVNDYRLLGQPEFVDWLAKGQTQKRLKGQP